MFLYRCDVKGCNYQSESKDSFKHIKIKCEVNPDLAEEISSKDICPECAKKILNKFAAYFDQRSSHISVQDFMHDCTVLRTSVEDLAKKHDRNVVAIQKLVDYNKESFIEPLPDFKFPSEYLAAFLSIKTSNMLPAFAAHKYCIPTEHFIIHISKELKYYNYITESIVTAYKNGMSLNAIVDKYGVPSGVLKCLLQQRVPKEYWRADVYPTPLVPCTGNVDVSMVLEMLNEGYTLDAICYVLECELYEVINIMNKTLLWKRQLLS